MDAFLTVDLATLETMRVHVQPAPGLPGLRRVAFASGMWGLSTIRRVSGELRRDVAAVRQRDPAATGVSTAEILTSWPGLHALLAHRVAHALDAASVPVAPRALAYVSRALTGIEIHPRGADRRRPVHRPRDGRRDRRDGRARRPT